MGGVAIPPSQAQHGAAQVFKELSVPVSSWRHPWADGLVTARHAQQLWAPHLAASPHDAWKGLDFYPGREKYSDSDGITHFEGRGL